VVDFVHRRNLTPDDDLPYVREPEYLVLLRLRLAQGDHATALALANRLLQQAETTNRTGDVIERLVLQALIFQAQKEMDCALASSKRALTLAQPEGFVRVFLDEGEPLAKLLNQAKVRQSGTGYAAELLSAIGTTTTNELPTPQLLIEPLSPRELEVLALIETGHSNQAIAARLVISLPTVKRHISNIYAKLGVDSRTQARSSQAAISIHPQYNPRYNLRSMSSRPKTDKLVAKDEEAIWTANSSRFALRASSATNGQSGWMVWTCSRVTTAR
jgi:LuxR family maltose regulon positive regulatory protein